MDIGNITISDHTPITIELNLLPHRPQFQWKLNDFLLADQEVKAEVERELTNYFDLNCTEDCDPAVIWEAHKTDIRGILIKVGTKKKKD